MNLERNLLSILKIYLFLFKMLFFLSLNNSLAYSSYKFLLHIKVEKSFEYKIQQWPSSKVRSENENDFITWDCPTLIEKRAKNLYPNNFLLLMSTLQQTCSFFEWKRETHKTKFVVLQQLSPQREIEREREQREREREIEREREREREREMIVPNNFPHQLSRCSRRKDENKMQPHKKFNVFYWLKWILSWQHFKEVFDILQLQWKLKSFILFLTQKKDINKIKFQLLKFKLRFIILRYNTIIVGETPFFIYEKVVGYREGGNYSIFSSSLVCHHKIYNSHYKFLHK